MTIAVSLAPTAVVAATVVKAARTAMPVAKGVASTMPEPAIVGAAMANLVALRLT